MTKIGLHHFENNPRFISKVDALVTTHTTGSPLVDAPKHTVSIALTPSAAADLLRNLDGATLPVSLTQLVRGLQGAAIHALRNS